MDADTLGIIQRLAANTLTERSALARGLGMQFDGRRDVFTAAGYDKTIALNQYHGRYERQDIASRIVDAPTDETWRLAPEIRDGLKWEEAKDDTPFVAAWNAVAMGGDMADDGDTTRGALHYLHQVDRLTGIGRYGVLLLGVRDGLEDLSQPLRKGAAGGPADLLYMNALGETHAGVELTTTDRRNRRYGLPEYYQLTLVQSPTSHIIQRVHWTRVVHVAEKALADEIYGTPRLQASWNRLLDVEKVLAGAGEAAWKLLDAGRVVTTKEGYELSEDEEIRTKQKAEIEDFLNNLRRWLIMEGIEVQELNGQMTDPSGLLRIIVAFISAATNIPQRLLMGSERGELASTQDEESWATHIEARQQQFAEPVILRPTINRLLWAGVLPAPVSGRYVIRWQPLRAAKEKEQSETADKVASALQRLGIQVEPAAFVRAYVPKLTEEDVSLAPKPEPVIVAPPAGDGQADGSDEVPDGPDDEPDDDEAPAADDNQQQDEEGRNGTMGQAGKEEPALNAGFFRRPGGDAWRNYP